jgi:hypothetical protein
VVSVKKSIRRTSGTAGFTLDQMNQVRRGFREIFAKLIERAAGDDVRLNEATLLDAYRKLVKQVSDDDAPRMEPANRATYGRLVGFGEHTRKYLTERTTAKATNPNQHRITRKHLERLKSFLLHPPLRLATDRHDAPVPTPGKSLDSWMALIAYAIEIISRAPAPSLIPDEAIAGDIRELCRPFLESYIVSTPTRKAVFGGRQADLDSLTAWLADDTARPRRVLTGPAGRGKTALLIRWLVSIDALTAGLDPWSIVYLPITPHIGTNRPLLLYEGLAMRLHEITRQPFPIETLVDRELAMRTYVRTQLEQLNRAGTRALVVVDAIDEAMARIASFRRPWDELYSAHNRDESFLANCLGRTYSRDQNARDVACAAALLEPHLHGIPERARTLLGWTKKDIHKDSSKRGTLTDFYLAQAAYWIESDAAQRDLLANRVTKLASRHVRQTTNAQRGANDDASDALNLSTRLEDIAAAGASPEREAAIALALRDISRTGDYTSLVKFGGLLSGDQVATLLEQADKSSRRVDALSYLAPLLPAQALAKALHMARQVRDDRECDIALTAIDRTLAGLSSPEGVFVLSAPPEGSAELSWRDREVPRLFLTWRNRARITARSRALAYFSSQPEGARFPSLHMKPDDRIGVILNAVLAGPLNSRNAANNLLKLVPALSQGQIRKLLFRTLGLKRPPYRALHTSRESILKALSPYAWGSGQACSREETC